MKKEMANFGGQRPWLSGATMDGGRKRGGRKDAVDASTRGREGSRSSDSRLVPGDLPLQPARRDRRSGRGLCLGARARPADLLARARPGALSRGRAGGSGDVVPRNVAGLRRPRGAGLPARGRSRAAAGRGHQHHG